MNLHPTIEVSIRRGNSILRQCIRVDECIFEKSLAPLPRNREIDPREYDAAVQQIKTRRLVVNHLAAKLADALLKMCEKEDPQMGYSPAEREQMGL